MRIISFSDLHLEFGTDIHPPPDSEADVMVLAGDILSLKRYLPLERYLENWKKPVLIVLGNHEYYTRTPMDEEERKTEDSLNLAAPLYDGRPDRFCQRGQTRGILGKDKDALPWDMM